LLNPEERSRIDAELASFRNLVAGTDANAIEQGIKTLEKACDFYVERRMNSNIRKAMAGHSVNEFEQEAE
jgi:molecular chaperone HscA